MIDFVGKVSDKEAIYKSQRSIKTWIKQMLYKTLKTIASVLKEKLLILLLIRLEYMVACKLFKIIF